MCRDMCQVCDTSRHSHDLSGLVRDSVCFLGREDGHPPVKIKAPLFIYLTGKLRKSLLLLALEKNRTEQNNKQNKPF